MQAFSQYSAMRLLLGASHQSAGRTTLLLDRVVRPAIYSFLNTVRCAYYSALVINRQGVQRCYWTALYALLSIPYLLKNRNELVAHGCADFGLVAGGRERAGVWIDAEGEDVVSAVVADD